MTAKKVTTIQDVAKRAKVSISTVSHVLNSTRHVEAGTKERILTAIKELDYRPNQLARGLRGAGSKTIGLIISDIREEFFAQLTKTIESAANDRGYMVMLCDSEESVEKERSYIDILSERGVDGIIIAPVDSRAAPSPRAKALPIVQVDRRCEGAAYDYIGIDNRECARQAVWHFASVGRKKLGFIGHEGSIATMSERAQGFSMAMRELGDSSGGRVLVLQSRIKDDMSRVAKWIKASAGLEGIVCGNANICYSVLEALGALKVEVPAGMGLVSFDDPACFAFIRSPITALRQPTESMGLAALEALLERASGGGGPKAKELLLPARLMVRESCGERETRR